MDDVKQYSAAPILRAAIDQLWGDSTRDRAVIACDLNGAVNAALDHLFFDLRLPRQSGKTTAIHDEVGPGDVVFCRDPKAAKLFAEKNKWMLASASMDGTPVAIFTGGEVDFAIREMSKFFSYFTHTIFFDEVPNARDIAGQMSSVLYHRDFKSNVERGYGPRFFSLRS